MTPAQHEASEPEFPQEHEPHQVLTAAEAAYTYTCHCHREPVHITLRASELPRRHARGHWRR
ncbi:hypothetical protein CU044_7191 [Streptomyces sp. L-9-10]|nr:hypothetical protein CU044_7191 [Streptomyces sp. L-9-10]